MAHINLPIIGDEKYGDYEINKNFHQKEQLLWNYSLKFCFTSNTGVLNYLNNKTFTLPNIQDIENKFVF